MLDICFFDVGLGQCIFLHPSENNAEYSTLIDCGSCQDFNPADFIKNYLPYNSNYKRNLKNLTLTNYDEDHFSGISDLKSKVAIETICFSKNLSSQEIKSSKAQVTPALIEMLDLKDRYNGAVAFWNPPYKKYTFSLDKSDLTSWDTNNLSMLTFIEYNGFVMCVPGDLEQQGWERILGKFPDIQPLLQKTRLFVASHHGRDNGYYPDIFNVCKPECIIISDDSVKYGTQESMSSIYSSHINGNGIVFNGNFRKVLTTRSDGHIIVKVSDYGIPTYDKLRV